MAGRECCDNKFSPLFSAALLAIVSGVLTTLSLAPFKLWPLALLSTFIFYGVIRQRSVNQAFFLGWLFGAGLFLSGASWVYVSIHDYGYTSAPLASILTLLFCSGLALCCAITWALYAAIEEKQPLNKQNGCSAIRHAALFSLLWIAGEWARSWLLSGFPWLFIGYSQTESILAGWAPIIGVYGIGWILCFSAAIARHFIQAERQHRPYGAIAVAVALWLTAISLEPIQWTRTEGPTLRVSLVQANISQHDKWRAEYRDTIISRHRKMSATHWQNSDLIIWPEAAIPQYYQQLEPLMQQLNARASESNTTLLTGIPYYDPYHRAAHNSVIALGEGSGVYHKQRLVPFGEYTPLQSLLGSLMTVFELPVAKMKAGSATQAPLSIGQWRSRPLICYEIVYPALSAAAARSSDVLITVSNDSWFGRSIGPLQHLQMAQMRALETGRYVLRGTGNGVSAIIRPDGSLAQHSQQFQRQVLVGEFRATAGNTPWVAAGHWMLPSAIALSLITLSLITLRRTMISRK